MQPNQPPTTPAPVPRPEPTPAPVMEPVLQPLDDRPRESALALKKKSSRSKAIWIVLVALLVACVMAAVAAYAWYSDQLTSPAPESTDTTRIVVEDGSTSDDVAMKLSEAGMIKNELAFKIYYRLNHTSGLKAGTYILEKKSSVDAIVAHLEKGTPDEFTLTFLPGATLSDAKKVLLGAGYSATEIDAASTKTYDHPLMAGKPADADIEGYVYGDTYSFMTGSTVEEIYERIFDHMYEDIQTEKLIEKYAARGMSLYEGITFASIVQAEESDAKDMAHASQVFHKRLEVGMELGSDVTFIYGARKLGVAPTVDLKSPYNTRIVTGLPPGPVSNPGYDAMVAGANPTNSDDLYFVAGDDGTTHFSKTLDEHERLTREYCQQNCILPSQ